MIKYGDTADAPTGRVRSVNPPKGAALDAVAVGLWRTTWRRLHDEGRWDESLRPALFRYVAATQLAHIDIVIALASGLDEDIDRAMTHAKIAAEFARDLGIVIR